MTKIHVSTWKQIHDNKYMSPFGLKPFAFWFWPDTSVVLSTWASAIVAVFEFVCQW
jgi:hypothetical protein